MINHKDNDYKYASYRTNQMEIFKFNTERNETDLNNLLDISEISPNFKSINKHHKGGHPSTHLFKRLVDMWCSKPWPYKLWQCNKGPTYTHNLCVIITKYLASPVPEKEKGNWITVTLGLSSPYNWFWMCIHNFLIFNLSFYSNLNDNFLICLL